MSDYTNGKPFLITQVEEIGEFSRRIHYLLPDGRRYAPIISTAVDTPRLRQSMGDALVSGRTNLTRSKRA